MCIRDRLEELSQGLRLAYDDRRRRELVLAPSFWATPFVILTSVREDKALFIYGARAADASLVPGELVPDALYQALKALADPTRLRILRYLSDEPMAPAQLARRLRVRAPKVIPTPDAPRPVSFIHLTLPPGDLGVVSAVAASLYNTPKGRQKDDGRQV